MQLQESSYEKRLLTCSDTEKIMILAKECFPVPYNRDNIQTLLWNPETYCAGLFDNEDLIAIVMGKNKEISNVNSEDLTGRNPFAELPSDATVSYLMLLGVTASHRKRSLATTLLQDFINHALKYNSRLLYLHTHTENEAAMKFYEKHNFEYSHTIESFYTFNGADQSANCLFRLLQALDEPQKRNLFASFIKIFCQPSS